MQVFSLIGHQLIVGKRSFTSQICRLTDSIALGIRPGTHLGLTPLLAYELGVNPDPLNKYPLFTTTMTRWGRASRVSLSKELLLLRWTMLMWRPTRWAHCQFQKLCWNPKGAASVSCPVPSSITMNCKNWCCKAHKPSGMQGQWQTAKLKQMWCSLSHQETKHLQAVQKPTHTTGSAFQRDYTEGKSCVSNISRTFSTLHDTTRQTTHLPLQNQHREQNKEEG